MKDLSILEALEKLGKEGWVPQDPHKCGKKRSGNLGHRCDPMEIPACLVTVLPIIGCFQAYLLSSLLPH